MPESLTYVLATVLTVLAGPDLGAVLSLRIASEEHPFSIRATAFWSLFCFAIALLFFRAWATRVQLATVEKREQAAREATAEMEVHVYEAHRGARERDATRVTPAEMVQLLQGDIRPVPRAVRLPGGHGASRAAPARFRAEPDAKLHPFAGIRYEALPPDQPASFATPGSTRRRRRPG